MAYNAREYAKFQKDKTCFGFLKFSEASHTCCSAMSRAERETETDSEGLARVRQKESERRVPPWRDVIAKQSKRAILPNVAHI